MEKGITRFLENARQGLREVGLEQKDLATQLGVTPQHLNAVLNGRSNLSRKLEKALCEKLHLQPPGWWNNRANPPVQEEATSLVRAMLIRNEEMYVLVPVKGGGDRAHMAFRQDWLISRAANFHKLFLVHADGDAMHANIARNAVVLVDGGQCVPMHDHVFYVRHDGVTSFCRLEVVHGKVRLRTPSGGLLEQPVEILGRALWQSSDL